MTWINDLLNDCYLEIAIEEQCKRIERAGCREEARLEQRILQELIKERSEAQVARMERDRLQKALKQ